ncbi:hypothetical protein H0H93_004568 [Arthromyces matolae]|nr:hypothetical protein H0H93_004568 [Arthromyces matolae]
MANISPQPCGACILAGQAVITLSSSIQDARKALDAAEKAMKSISVPLPNDVAVALGYSLVDLSGVPDVFRRYCQSNDLHILKGSSAQPGIVHARAVYNHNQHASSDAQVVGAGTVLPSANGPIPLSANPLHPRNETSDASTLVTHANDGSSSPSGVTSLSSGDSTDWEQEYHIDPATMSGQCSVIILQNDAKPVFSVMNGLMSRLSRPSTPVQIENSTRSSADHVASDERWYVVIVGREPGVIQGHRNRLDNVEGVPKADSYRVSSEQDGWREFFQRLEKGEVVQVQMVRQEKRLTAADFAPQ